uniref:Cadherin 15, type 1, M-cadherin (myotubule) n=1 Tax=Paramormyrops kingsleyae TaxID=1676925 RepID=A0A3B3S7C7_9TELE
MCCHSSACRSAQLERENAALSEAKSDRFTCSALPLRPARNPPTLHHQTGDLRCFGRVGSARERKMVPQASLGFCMLVAVAIQACCAAHMGQKNADVLHPWRGFAAGSAGRTRMKRDWIIPPIRISENSKQVPEKIVQIKSDKVYTGKVIYKLEGPGVDQDPKDFFEIEDTTGWIRSKKQLDREKYSRFNLKAFALSPSGERVENPSTIEIIVMDQNDNKPNFTQSEFVGYVPEFSLPGTAVINVSATDADDPETENAILRYSIIMQECFPPFSVNKTMFGINNVTGTVYIRDVGLDLAVVKFFKLKLQVSDMSGEGLSDFAYATIYITDINNNAPQFPVDQYAMTAPENRGTYEIGRVHTKDNDEPGTANWKTVYSIIKGDPSGHFAVHTDPETNEGVLYVVKPLDYEVTKQHRLVLTAQNEAPLSHKAPRLPVSSSTVTVTVLNENEAPRFVESPIRLEVPESVVAGTVLTVAKAQDPEGDGVRFYMEYDPEKWLRIDPVSGEIVARKTFDPRSASVKHGIYHAVIKVSDTDGGGSSTTATVEIKLRQTNDFPPQLVPPASRDVCAGREARSGLFLSALDLDMSPHAEPFSFKLVDHSASNWTIQRVNETHSWLFPHSEVEPGLYYIPIRVSDIGGLFTLSMLNVTVCRCDVSGVCNPAAAAFFAPHVGISITALLVIIGSIFLLLLMLLLVVAVRNCRLRPIKKGSILKGVSDDDIRDNVLNYNEQGGGEEDENAYNIEQLRNPSKLVPPFPGRGSVAVPATFFPPAGSGFPSGRQPLRKDAPHDFPSPMYPRKPPADPADIEDFINDGLDAADKDPNIPPYDTVLIYDYEGDGSVAGSLSTIASGSSDEDQDYDYLSDWGPRFKKLANLYDPH